MDEFLQMILGDNGFALQLLGILITILAAWIFSDVGTFSRRLSWLLRRGKVFPVAGDGRDIQIVPKNPTSVPERSLVEFCERYKYKVPSGQIRISHKWIWIDLQLHGWPLDQPIPGEPLATRITGHGRMKGSVGYLIYHGRNNRNQHERWTGTLVIEGSVEGPFHLYFHTEDTHKRGQFLFGRVILNRVTE